MTRSYFYHQHSTTRLRTSLHKTALTALLLLLCGMVSQAWAASHRFFNINNKEKACINYTIDTNTLTVHEKERSLFAGNFRFYTTEAAAKDDANGTPVTIHLISRAGDEVFSYTPNGVQNSDKIALNSNLVSPYAKNYHYYGTVGEAKANSGAGYTTYGEVVAAGGADIYVGYDYNAAAGLALDGTKAYSFHAGESEGDNYYMAFNSLTSTAQPNNEYTGDDSHLFFLKGSDPYRVQIECTAFSGYYVAATANDGDVLPAHNGTTAHLYNDVTQTTYFSLLANNQLIDFARRTADGNVYVMYWNGSNRLFSLFGGSTPTAFKAESEVSEFLSGSMPFSFVERERKVSVTMHIVSIDHDGTGGKKLYTISFYGDKDQTITLPQKYLSPLAKNYTYYTEDQFTLSAEDKYILKDDATPSAVFPHDDSSPKEYYVKYEYNPDNLVAFGTKTINVDLTGKARYTINTNSETQKTYFCWNTTTRTLDSSNDSYEVSLPANANRSDPVTAWNNFYLWRFEGSDPYAFTIRSAMAGMEHFFVTPQNGVGGNGSNTWLVPDATKKVIIRTWALLSDNKLISEQVPGKEDIIVCFNNNGWSYQDNFNSIRNEADVLLNKPAIGYHIVSKAGADAVSTHVAFPANLSEALSVPAALKSAHIIDDGYHYRFFRTLEEAAAYTAATTDADRALRSASAISTYGELDPLTEVYVGYFYDADNIPNGMPKLAATVDKSARYFVQVGTDKRYLRYENDNKYVRYGEGGNRLTSIQFQWTFTSPNNDPYDIRIRTPREPDNYLHANHNNLTSTAGTNDMGQTIYFNNTTTDKIHSFFFAKTDAGLYLTAAYMQNKSGGLPYLYYQQNSANVRMMWGQIGASDNQLVELTGLSLFHMVNKAGNVALSVYASPTSPLTVPTGLRTPVMEESQYRFFTSKAAAKNYNDTPTAETATAQGAITQANIGDVVYIGYKYINDMDVLDLSGERWYHIRGSSLPNTSAEDLYYSKEQDNKDWYAIFAYKKETMPTLTPYTNLNSMFSFEGNDPYDLTIRNGYKGGGSGTEPWYLKMGNEKGTSQSAQREIRVDANVRSSFLLLEHEDGYSTIAVRRPNLDDSYIGKQDYLYFLTSDGSINSRSYANYNLANYTYYSDRNSASNNYASKIYFEPIFYETTFHIIDHTGREAIKYKGEFPANMPIDFAHIPAPIRSPLIANETITAYSTATNSGKTASDGRTIWNLSNEITKTPPTEGTDVYVTYTINNVFNMPFRLTGRRAFNVRINGGNYVYSTGTYNADLAATADDSQKTTDPFYWHLVGDGADYDNNQGGDPYAFQLWNNGAGNDKYLKYDTETGKLTLNGTKGEAGTYFIAMRNNVDALYEVLAATGDDAATNYYNIGYDGKAVKLFPKNTYGQGNPELQMQLSTNELKALYHIIDKQNKIVITTQEEDVELQVPAPIRSPLVERYHFYTLKNKEDKDIFTITGEGEDATYKLKIDEELPDIASANKEEGIYQIYVTYDVGDKYYLPTKKEIETGSKETGGTLPLYRLKFWNGDSFRQEDQHDHVMNEATKAIYPYANGEANFYVYGQTQLDTQMGAAATTRSRWPWFFESVEHDPYHVKVCAARTTYSLRTPTQEKAESSLRLYFRTHEQTDKQGNTSVITSAITEHSAVTDAKPTEYMILGTANHLKLTTTSEIGGQRQTVNSFEQYWKNNPTVQEELTKHNPDWEVLKDEDMTAVYRKYLYDNMHWHSYDAWASVGTGNSQTQWESTSNKRYQKSEHWFQTIKMGEDFDIEEMSIEPALVLVDRHGWEIMRKPIPQTKNGEEAKALMASTYGDAIRPYNSPMVKVYKFWHVGSKRPSYHKYEVSEPITVSGVPYTATSLTAIPPYNDADNLWEVNSSGVPNLDRVMDIYVTYDVKEEYESSYTPAATAADTKSSPFLIHQGNSYATTTDGTTITTTTIPDEAIAQSDASKITDNMRWYIKPNFDIDAEMGYTYGEPGATEGPKSKDETEQDYVSGTTPEWSNGFDPYNLQIQNEHYETYFTTNATTASLDNTSSMAATYDGAHIVSLTDATATVDGKGHDNVTIHITNTTFMAVQDENGNMRLMPRFDHHSRLTNFTTSATALPTAPVNDRVGAQTTLLIRPLAYTYIIVDNTGHESLRYKGKLGEVSPSIPTHFASPLAKDFVYYKDLYYDEDNQLYTEIPDNADISEKLIGSTFAVAGLTNTENNVYVRYSFNPEGDKYKILSEGDWHTISINGRPIYVDYPETWPTEAATLHFAEEDVTEYNTDRKFQCKFIYNPDTETPDPYNTMAINHVHPTYRWEDAHYAVLAHGDSVAFAVARQGGFDYSFLSSGADGKEDEMQVYVEPAFSSTGTFNGTVSQITFGDVPMEKVTYYIITNDGKLAMTAKEPETRAKGEPSLPTAILPPWARSPLLNVSDFVYYNHATYDKATETYTVNDEDRTTRLLGLPSDIVYVRYNYNRETCPFMVWDTFERNSEHPGAQSPIDLTGEVWYNLVSSQWGDDWFRATSTNDNLSYIDRPYQYKSFNTYPMHDGIFDFQGSKEYMLRLTGSDPYAVKITSALKGENRQLSSPVTGDSPYLLYFSANESDPVKTFMLLAPRSNLVIAATGKPYLALDNPRWNGGSRWLFKHETDYDAEAENPFNFVTKDENGKEKTVGFSSQPLTFYMAPTFREYVFHAVKFDQDNNNLGETWTAKLRRNWLTTAKLEDDITRLYSLYEQYGTTDEEKNEFKTREALANRARFYADADLTERLYDATSKLYDVYPEIKEDGECHIYFKYKIDTEATDIYGKKLADLASTAEQIDADADAYKAATAKTDENGYTDDSPANSFYGFTPQANWFFMVMDTDADVTRNADGSHVGNQYFVWRQNDGSVGYLPGTYGLHKEDADNYQTWSYNRLAEWYKEGDHEAFREGRWLWTLVGNDPYTMQVLNFEGVNGVTSAENDGYSLAGTPDSYASYGTTTVAGTTYHPVQILSDDSEPLTAEEKAKTLWGLCPGYGTGNTFRLQANGVTDHGYALYWKMRSYKEGNNSTTTGVMMGTEENIASDLQLLPFTPSKFEDVQMVIRRSDDPDVVNPKGAASDAYEERNKQSGITTDFASASSRRFMSGDVVEDLASGSSIPEIMQRKFCTYKVWRDCYSNRGNCIISSDGEGAKRVFISYDVTTDMFLKNEPDATEVARMARENDHVYFMDFRDSQPLNPALPLTTYDTGYHAFYKQGMDFSTDMSYNRTKWKGSGNTGRDAYTEPDGKNHWVYQTTRNRMESVPEHLKWYFVGDPYALQVFCTREPGKNLARFHDTETNYQFILDCVHLRASEEVLPTDKKDAYGNYLDGNKYDVREYVYDLDENGQVQYEADGVTVKQRINEYRNQLRFPKFYWEVVPCRSSKADAFALRFQADNTSLSYKNIYYYLAHNGLKRAYTKFVDRDNKEYNIDLSYRKENSLNQSDFDFTGLHEANNDMTIIRLIQPTRVYMSAKNAGGEQQTTDELSEYFALGEALDSVPRHYRRKYADYYDLTNRYPSATLKRAAGHASSTTNFAYPLTLGNAFVSDTTYTHVKNYDAASAVKTSCTVRTIPNYVKNPTFKFDVFYRPLNSAAHPYPFTTEADLASGNITWVDINVGTSSRDVNNIEHSHYLYSDKYESDASVVTKFDSIQYLKGMHWALVGDPYNFTMLNRRQYEGRISADGSTVNPQSLQWLGTASEVNAKGINVSYARLTDKSSNTDWAGNTSVDDTGSGNTRWSLCFFKTGNDNDYYVRTYTPKTTDDENAESVGSDDLFTNKYGRLTTNAVDEDNRIGGHMFYVEPFSLQWGIGSNARTTIYTVAKDGDAKDNDCFDANVYVYKIGTHTPVADLRSIELPYGKALDVLPWSLRRYGCDYSCYLDYDAATNVGRATDTFSPANIGTAAGRPQPVSVAYEYIVNEDVAKFFTSEEEAQQDAYNWTNSYFYWQQPYTNNSQEGVTVTERVKVGDHVNEDGKIDGEIYEYFQKTIYPTTDGASDAYGWVNSHTGNTEAYADQRTQTDNNDQKWALIGDPYGFEMKNYQFYLDGVGNDLFSDITDIGKANIGFSVSDASRWTIAIADDGNTYLALCDANGNVLRYVTFDRVDKDNNELGPDEQNLRFIGLPTTLPDDPTGNRLNVSDETGDAKPFFLSGLKNYASVVIYHLVIGHQKEKEAYDTYYAKAAANTLTEEETQKLKDDYGITPAQLKGMSKADYNALTEEEQLDAYKPADNELKRAAMGYVYRSYSYYDNTEQPVNSIKLHEDEVKKYFGEAADAGRTTLRDIMNFPIDDYVSHDVGVGNRLNVPWYMRRQFCNYTLYRRDVLQSELLTDAGGEPILDAEGNRQFTWKSILTPEERNSKELLSTVQPGHKDKMLIVDVVYDVDDTNFRFSDQGRNTTAWYSMMTQDEKADGLLNFSYKDGVGARLDHTVHYTNNYLWAPVGDPYGFTLHNRYATVNGTGWDNVVVTNTGKLPQEDAASADADYRANYTSADGSVRYVDSRIVHLGKGEKRADGTTVETWGAMNANYEMFESNYDKAFLMHPVSATIDVTDKQYSSNFMLHDVDTHRSYFAYGRANAFRSTPEASWQLKTTAEQLWPYFERSGYVGGLDPTIAMRSANQSLRATIKSYVDNPAAERDFQKLDKARKLVYSGTFVNAKTDATVNTGDPRPKEGLRFKSANLVNMKPGYYRIKAFSEEALKLDGMDMSGTGIKGVVGPRYISGYHFLSASKVQKLNGDTPEPGGRWLHFHETDADHATIRTFKELNDIIQQVDEKASSDDVHNFSGRDIDPHPSMRGNIEIPAVEYDPASIFHFSEQTDDPLGRYNFSTQGLRVRTRAGGTQGETAVYGQTVMSEETGRTFATGDANTVDPATQHYNYFDDRYRIDDIGGTAVTLRVLDPKVKVNDTWVELTDDESFEKTVGENIKTNYLCIDRNHRYRITAHWDNEMVEIGDHHTTNFGLNGIQDTKWLLQPVGTNTDEYHNQMPLRVEVQQGSDHPADMLGTKHYYYGTLYVPFDTRLANTTDGAFTATYQPSPSTVNLTALSLLNNQGNNQYIPACWPVVIRTSVQKTDTQLGKSYVELDLPYDRPQPLGSYGKYLEKGGDPSLQGSFLEQTLPEASLDGKQVMVLALPFVEGNHDRLSYGTDKAEAYYNYDSYNAEGTERQQAVRVGFYTNENWAREGWDSSEGTLGAAAYVDANEQPGCQQAYDVDARTATYQQRSNRYVYHNKVYFLYKGATAPARGLTILFGGDDDQPGTDPDVYEADGNERAGYVFDLAGRLRAKGQTPTSLRMNQPGLPAGVYIYRGRKVVVQ